MLKPLAPNPALYAFVADNSRMNCELMAASVKRSRYKLNIVGYATDSAGVRAGFSKNSVDVAVISAHLRDGVSAGFSVTRDIRWCYPMTSVIMLLDSLQVTVVVEGFRAGGWGILSPHPP